MVKDSASGQEMLARSLPFSWGNATYAQTPVHKEPFSLQLMLNKINQKPAMVITYSRIL